MSDKINRLYGGLSDTKMLLEAQTIHNLLDEDLTQFTDFDPDFADVPLALQNAIDAGQNVQTDETIMDIIQQTTDTLEEKWELCRAKFQDTKFFIEKAFPKNSSRWQEFGYDDYDEMAAKQDKVQSFMVQFHKACVKYQTELLDVNYNLAKIAEIETVLAAFLPALANQNAAIKARGSQTQERVKIYNAAWVILQKISKASKSIYRNDYAKTQAYLLPGSATNEQREELSILLHIKGEDSNLPLADAVGEIVGLDVTDNADETGTLAFAKLADGNYVVKVMAPGHMDKNVNVVLAAGALFEQEVGLSTA